MKFLDHRSMSGRLFQYGQGRQAFVSGPAALKRCCILIGGLSDGILACPYAVGLSAALEKEGWATVQPVLRSSYCQFGFGSLDNDCEDVRELIESLEGCEEVAVVGHSTGSQIAAHLVHTGGHATLRHVVFQAGCSDRETDDDAELSAREPFLSKARAMVTSGDGGEFMPRSCFWAPLTAQRYLDLFAFDGADDYFSSDLPDETLEAKFANFGHEAIHALVAYSGNDEYAPKSLDKAKLVKRLCAAIDKGGAPGTRRVSGILVTNGSHNLSKDDRAAGIFIDAVIKFLTGVAIDDACFENVGPWLFAKQPT